MCICPFLRCQCSVADVLRGFLVACLLLAAPSQALSQSLLPGTPETALRTPPPPAWQRDLEAARVLQAAAWLGPSPAGAAARQTQRDSLRKLYTDLAAKYPDRGAVQRAAGDYIGELGQRDLAVPYWQRAQALDPHDFSSAESLGSAALANGDTHEARRQFQFAVDAKPGEALFHFELANVLYLFRHDLADPVGAAGCEAALVDALEQFRLAATLAPQDARLAQAYAESFYILAKPDWNAALAAWERVRALQAPNFDFANGQLARVSLRLGRSDAADQYLEAIHDPHFEDLKKKLHLQADKVRQQAAVERPSPGTEASPAKAAVQ